MTEKILLIDFSNIAHATLHIDLRDQKENSIKTHPNFFKHLLLNNILYHKNRFKIAPENVIICLDHKWNWRRKVFQYYKSHRAVARAASDVDYDEFYRVIDEFYHELTTYFPFRTLQVKYAEADDIIAILAKYFIDNEVIIVSSDRDFVQLQKYKQVKMQWNPIFKKRVEVVNPEREILVKIACGDAGDGVPNIVSPDNVFVTEPRQRQKSLGGKKVNALLDAGLLKKFILDNDLKKAWDRNYQLISFDKIPVQLTEIVLNRFKELAPNKSKALLMSYFSSGEMKILHGRVNEFFSDAASPRFLEQEDVDDFS